MTAPGADPPDVTGLDPVITVETAALFGYEVTEADLLRASTRIRAYTRQRITPGESTVTLGGSGPWLLPERPVVRVTAIDGAEVNLQPNQVPGASALAGAVVVNGPSDPTAWALRQPRLVGGFLHAPGVDLVVTWQHGFDPLPAALAELVAQVATRLAATPDALLAGVTQENTGSEGISYGAQAAYAVAELTPGERAVLDRFYPPLPRTTRMRAPR